jgi:hypothetical protein
MRLKYGRSTGDSAYARKGTTSRVIVASRSKVSFDQMPTPASEIMDGSLFSGIQVIGYCL